MRPNPLLSLTFEQATKRHAAGLCTDRDYREFVLLWTWSAPRYGGDAGRAHDRAHQRLGTARYWRRLARGRDFLTRRSVSGLESPQKGVAPPELAA